MTAPQAGGLLVTLQERGLSVSAHLDGAAEAASPVARIGTIELLASTAGAQTHTLHVRTQDDHDLAGDVCAIAELIPASTRLRLAAEQAFADAAQAVYAESWQTAFDRYLSAARGYDELGLRRRAAQARHALAELAYRRFDRKRDSYALASLAVQDFGNADPVYIGALAALQAKALIDMPGSSPKALEPQIRERLAAARRYESASSLGARELLRLDLQTGFLEYRLDAQDRAAAIFSDVARRCRAAHDWDCYGTASQNLALFAEERSNYALALSTYADALHSLDPQLNPRLVADIQDNLGHLQGQVGLFSASERTHAEAMVKYARLGDCPGFRRTLARAGSLLVQIGTLGDAEHDLSEAASLDCTDLLAGVATSRQVPALQATNLRRATILPREAETDRQEHERLCQHAIAAASLGVDNQVVVFNALLSLGDALQLEGESTRAERCINASQSYAATARARMRFANARGSMLLEQRNAAAARASFEQTLRIADQARIPSGNEHRGAARLGIVRAQLLAGDGAAALGGAYQALRSSVARGDLDQTITSLQLVASAYRTSGQNAEAGHALQVALALSEAVPIDELDGETRATYLATQHTVFASLTDLFASQAAGDAHLSWQAFAISERGRARSLRYAETQQARDAQSSFDAPPAARYQHLLRDVVQLTGDAQSGSGLIDALGQAAMRESVPADEPDREQIQQALKRLDATLVEYAAGSHNMLAFVLDANGLSIVKLGDRSQISAAVAQLRDRLRDAESPAAAVRAAAQRLASLVLWPVRAGISAHQIIFVPDDSLHTVPFSVLPWSSEPDAPLLVERTESVVAPSAAFLTRARQASHSSAAAPRIVAIGDPVFRLSEWQRDCLHETQTPSVPRPSTSSKADRAASDWTEYLPRLPGTRDEVSELAKLARQAQPTSHVEILLGCAAVASALRAAANAGADLLHIATHARVDAERPRLSALALTPDTATNPPTSAFGLLDILGLKLKSRLVVLSACDTSRGRLLPGEGVLGPAQAFLQAGSAAVLASYWRVDDAATAQFMQKFYTHLFAGHQSAAAALRSAQLDAAHSSSFHTWAAFALYGWPDSSI
jgi:CHAT domain-containing protein